MPDTCACAKEPSCIPTETSKGTSDWAYAWIPVAGPLIGGALSGLIYNVAFK